MQLPSERHKSHLKSGGDRQLAWEEQCLQEGSDSVGDEGVRQRIRRREGQSWAEMSNVFQVEEGDVFDEGIECKVAVEDEPKVKDVWKTRWKLCAALVRESGPNDDHI